MMSKLDHYRYKQLSLVTLLLPNSDTLAPPRLLDIPHLLTRHHQMHLHSAATALVYILDLLSLLDIESATLTLAIYPPFGLQCNTRVPASHGSVHSPTGHVKAGRRLAIESGLMTGGLDNVFPQVSSCC